MAAQDPARRLTPVVRLAPAKVNLTLAVLGTRPDGYHELHSVMVPLDLADRLSVSAAPPGGSDTPARRRLRPRPGRGQPRPPRDRRRPPCRASRMGAAGRPAAARRAAREADPHCGRAGRRLLGRGRGRRCGPRGLGCGPGRRRAPRALRRARLGRPVLPRGRAGARRGTGRAPHAARLAPGRRRAARPPGAPPDHACRGDLHARVVPCVGRRRPCHRWRRAPRLRASRRGAAREPAAGRRPARAGGGARVRERPRPGGGRRPPGARAVQAGAAPRARQAGWSLGLRTDPLGALSFTRGGRCGRPAGA